MAKRKEVVPVKRSFSRRTAGHSDHVVESIKQNDFTKIEELLKDGPRSLTDYVENLCLFRMSVFGYIAENRSHIDRLDMIIDRLDQNRDGHGPVKLPEKFETARSILLRITEKSHFERVLEEVRSIA